jgi:C4-dicarboxylate-specific signal transduction histidine kinase
MKIILDDDVFHSLHPFSCVCDENSRVVTAGRSLTKLIPTVQPGELIWDHVRLLQPTRQEGHGALEQLTGELIVLTDHRTEAPILRGHVVHIPTPPTRYLFALHPTAVHSKQLAESGLNFSDFELGDPVFDFILLIRHLELANEKLGSAVTALELDSQLSAALCEIATAVFAQESERRIYERCLELVCDRLGWSVGHVIFIGSTALPCDASGLWYGREQQFLELFRSATDELGAAVIDEVPADARLHAKVAWVSEYPARYGGARAATLQVSRSCSAVWVPILVAGETVALLEFVSTTPQKRTDTYMHFFELLRYQLAQAIVHVRAHEAERQRLAAMAHASKMATLGQIVAGVAHEINNPISTISLIAAILKRSSENGAVSTDLVHTQATRLESCTQRLGTIVSELRGFSRDTTKDAPRSESIRAIVTETLDLCSAGFSAKGISLICDEVPEEWRVVCHSSQISQVLLNLLCNAQDAVLESEERWVRLEVSDSKDWFELSVSDSGSGIPEEIRDKILTPFFTTKPPGKGTGLGLSISANIMVDHGGSLYLDESAPYTRFVVRLPR